VGKLHVTPCHFSNATAGNLPTLLSWTSRQDPDDGLRAAHGIIAVLDRAGISLPRLLHGCDATMWPIFRESLRLGIDSRIGFEDGGLLPSGERAADNAALVGAALALRTA
jgi:uncharacterized protein (DUF849 family)